MSFFIDFFMTKFMGNRRNKGEKQKEKMKQFLNVINLFIDYILNNAYRTPAHKKLGVDWIRAEMIIVF